MLLKKVYYDLDSGAIPFITVQLVRNKLACYVAHQTTT